MMAATESQSTHPATKAVIAIATVGLTIFGWKLFLFMTDDAYIAFRYASNSLMGRGLVWNPAPFRPVEGYTSFLWVVLMREIWRFGGIQPPDSANIVSLLCGIATLYIGYRFLLRITLPDELERWRWPFLALAMLGTVTNRTFLTWLSSGLETALFNLLFTWWLYVGTERHDRYSVRWVLSFTSAAALCELCRPDGLLIVGATAFILTLEKPPTWKHFAATAPLLATPIHVAWRRLTYGDWVPNTYRAKYEGAWPESGIRYVASFVLEYGVWLWAIFGAVVLVRWLRSRPAVDRDELVRVIPVAVLVAHATYYTFIIGGDHFEYRVYSHLVLLLMISGVWFASRLARSGTGAVLLVGSLLVVSYPIPWVHWWATRDLNTREPGKPVLVPIADRFVWPARPVVAEWDDLQDWLIRHLVGMRHQEHKVFEKFQVQSYPTREEGEKISWDDRDVRVDSTVGIPGWVLPNVAIIDARGLNDRVVARHRPPEFVKAGMAHGRKPPEGYAECFRPNVFVHSGHVLFHPRQAPLTDDEIRACEARDWEMR